ncbi:MAG: hypothetical protein J6J36_00505 [Clostridia bacterium]|nr:hypothetical protein [Clostridia bacterium]
MDIQKIGVRKQYDQLRGKKIGDIRFNIWIYDFDFDGTEKVVARIREENDAEENTIVTELRRSSKYDLENFMFYNPINKNTVIQFQLVILDAEDNVLEESAIQSYYYEGLVFDKDDIQSHPQFDVIQLMLRSLNETIADSKEAVMKYLEEDDLANELRAKMDSFIAEKNEEVNNMKVDINTVIEQLSTLLDDFIKEGEE